MSMWQEDWIMAEVGLGSHFSWYSGSGSCEHIRKDAVRKLPEVIQAHRDAYLVVRGLMSLVGASAARCAISAPQGVLIALAREVAEYVDTSAYSLKNTWQCISDVLEAHLYAGVNEGSDSELNYANACVEAWAPKVNEASRRIDMMGFYAEDWLHSGPRITTSRGKRIK